MPAHETISEHTRPAPKRRPWRRNACTLTPAIGASTTRVGTSTSRIHQDERKSCVNMRKIVAAEPSCAEWPLAVPFRPATAPLRRAVLLGGGRDGQGSHPHQRG